MLELNINSLFIEESSLPEDNVFVWANYFKIFNKFDVPVIIHKRLMKVLNKEHDFLENKINFEDGKQIMVMPSDDLEYANAFVLNIASVMLEYSVFFSFGGADELICEKRVLLLETPYSKGFVN